MAFIGGLYLGCFKILAWKIVINMMDLFVKIIKFIVTIQPPSKRIPFLGVFVNDM